MGRDTLLAPGETHALRRGPLEVDLSRIDPEVRGKILAHGGEIGRELGSLRDHRGIDVGDPETERFDQAERPAQEDAAVDPRERRLGIGEMPADVAEARGSQECIANRMDERIAVGMGEEPALDGGSSPRRAPGAARYQAVGIVAVADAHHSWSRERRYRAARARSSGRVILHVAGMSLDQQGREAHPFHRLRLVRDHAAACRTSSNAAIKAPSRNICGVCACHSRSRATVPSTSPARPARFRAVAYRHGQETADGMVRERLDQAIEVRSPQARPRGVVYQDPVVPIALDAARRAPRAPSRSARHRRS